MVDPIALLTFMWETNQKNYHAWLEFWMMLLLLGLLMILPEQYH